MDDVQEKVFYQDANVLVTNTRLVINGKTYAIRNISSVAIQMAAQKFIIESILFFIGFAEVIFRSTRIIGILFIVGSIVIAVMRKSIYCVRINSNAGEIDELISKDKEYIQKIVNAIQESIVYRG